MTLEARVSCFDTNLTRRTHPQHAESNKNKQLLRNSQKWESFSELLALKSAACHQKRASRNSAADPLGSRQSGARAAAPNPTSLAPGARMT